MLEIDRLPCLATLTPAPATTNETAVEILKVPEPSPPVPQTSTTLSFSHFILITFSRIALTKPATSSEVSPFILSAVKSDAIFELFSLPLIIEYITS